MKMNEKTAGWKTAGGHRSVDEVIEGAPAPRVYNADTLYRSATLEERIRHNKVAESKAATANPHPPKQKPSVAP